MIYNDCFVWSANKKYHNINFSVIVSLDGSSSICVYPYQHVIQINWSDLGRRRKFSNKSVCSAPAEEACVRVCVCVCVCTCVWSHGHVHMCVHVIVYACEDMIVYMYDCARAYAHRCVLIRKFMICICT